MKIKNYLKIAALTAIVGFGAASCSQMVVPDDNGGGGNSGNGKMDVTFSLGHYTDGLTTPDKDADNTKVGWDLSLPSLVVFTDAKDKITYASGITDQKTATDGQTLAYSELFDDEGKAVNAIKNVSNKTTKIYFWGNISRTKGKSASTGDTKGAGNVWDQIKGTDNTYPMLQVGKSVADIKALLAQVSTQSITPTADNNSAFDATLYGMSDQFTKSGDGKASVTVKLAPLVTRVQIMRIYGSQKPNEVVKSFNLIGIYMDNFQPNIQIDGTVLDNNKLICHSAVSEESTQDNSEYFDPSKSKFAYKAENGFAELADYTTDTNKDLTPSKVETNKEYSFALPDQKVWAYNLFGGYSYSETSTPPADTATPVPSIVVRVSNVKDGNDKVTAAPQYLVIRKWYTSPDHTTSEIKSFEAGKIYRITDLEVQANQIKPDPSGSNMDVSVTVGRIDWKSQTIYQ